MNGTLGWKPQPTVISDFHRDNRFKNFYNMPKRTIYQSMPDLWYLKSSVKQNGFKNLRHTK